MRKYQLQFALFAVLALFTVTSCQKDGSEGPEGPAGPAGPAGPQGNPGSANVIYSDWLDVTYDTYSSPAPGDTIYYATILAPKLTAEIINSGEIKVYANINTASDPTIVALPFSDQRSIYINAAYYAGNIELSSNIPASTFTNDGETILQYRYVLIPGGVLAVKPDNVKLDTYQDVQKYLNLKN